MIWPADDGVSDKAARAASGITLDSNKPVAETASIRKAAIGERNVRPAFEHIDFGEFVDTPRFGGC